VGQGRQRMSDEVLEKMIKDYLKLRFSVSGFAWQGGEPMLMGLDFYKRAVELQKKFAGPGQQVSNALQTNAILLDEEWCKFLHEYNFLAGISIDGPRDVHNRIRGSEVFDKVLNNIMDDQRVLIAPTLSRSNYRHIDELIDLARETNVGGITFSLYTSHKKENDPLLLAGRELEWTLSKLREAWKKNKDLIIYDALYHQPFKK